MNTQAPILIAATGGSGTRLITKLCQHAHIHMGKTENLNNSLDAMPFVPFLEHWLNPYLTQNLSSQQESHMQADFQTRLQQHRDPLKNKPEPSWGWKNPRTILILPFLHQQCPQLRFIHLIRDGRDMAYSTNQNQVRKHAHAFLSTEEQQQYNKAERALIYWSRSNLKAARYAKAQLGERYLCLRFEALCQHPKNTLEKLYRFLGFSDTQSQSFTEQYHTLIKPPSSIGRWQQQFSSEQERQHFSQLGAQALQYFGYSR